MRISYWGRSISATIPHSKRERRRSSKFSRFPGARSLVMTIWFEFMWRSLKVLKNSSCVPSLRCKNCISSIRSRSVVRYFVRKPCADVRLTIDSTYSFMKVSDVTYNTFFSGWLAESRLPIACNKCVLPNPTSP